MRQRQLERDLARATGESVTIRRLGFSHFDPQNPSPDTDEPDWGPSLIDWDQFESERIALAIQA